MIGIFKVNDADRRQDQAEIQLSPKKFKFFSIFFLLNASFKLFMGFLLF